MRRRSIGFRFGLGQASLPGKKPKKREQLVLWERLIRNAGIEKQRR
jgi:hypothetical protein